MYKMYYTILYYRASVSDNCLMQITDFFRTKLFFSENAYYYVNPPEVITVVKKERPVMHQFVRKILYQDLQKNNTDKIMRLMRRLDWNNEETYSYAIKCLTGAHNVKYFNIR